MCEQSNKHVNLLQKKSWSQNSQIKHSEKFSFNFHSRPDRYVALFGEYTYDYSKWRPSVPIVEQLRAFKELIDEGKVMSSRSCGL